MCISLSSLCMSVYTHVYQIIYAFPYSSLYRASVRAYASALNHHHLVEGCWPCHMCTRTSQPIALRPAMRLSASIFFFAESQLGWRFLVLGYIITLR